MTRLTNARLAGIAFLFYIAIGITSLAARSAAPGTTAFFTVLMSFSALVLGVTLWAITRDVDPDIAMMAMLCRVLEAAPGGQGEIYFAVGSLLFSWLLLRGRLIPVWMAQLGVVASALLVVILPLKMLGLLGGSLGWSSPVTWLQWIPMLVFELAIAIWFLTKGVAAPARTARAEQL
jgi:hypothetical protein